MHEPAKQAEQAVTPGQQFASDNTAGLCPEAMAALRDANAAAVPSYGNDAWTARAADLIRDTFQTDAEVFFCFTGTAANSMAIAHLCHSYHSVICHELAHIETDECGGPEFFTHGTKVLLAPGDAGRLDPAAVEMLITRRTDIHFPRPRVLSLTQPSELGTVYCADQIGALCDIAKRHGLRVHMDGARFAQAVNRSGASPAELTWKAGVDVLCFGGTKHGMLACEAVVFFDRALAGEFDYRCKQAGQLASKMRFLAAPWVALLEDGAWLRHAAHAHRQAEHLARRLGAIDGVRLLHPVEANAVFVALPNAVRERLRARGWAFYEFIGTAGARLMCSWATRDADIDALVSDAAGG